MTDVFISYLVTSHWHRGFQGFSERQLMDWLLGRNIDIVVRDAEAERARLGIGFARVGSILGGI